MCKWLDCIQEVLCTNVITENESNINSNSVSEIGNCEDERVDGSTINFPVSVKHKNTQEFSFKSKKDNAVK